MNLPKDPIILFSVVNTALRDRFQSLEDFAEAYEADPEELRETLGKAGYVYDSQSNRFTEK